MKPVASLLPRLSLRNGTSLLFALAGFAAVGLISGCGSSGSQSGSPVLGGNTSVTLLISSTANDQLSQFNVDFSGISLTSQSGKTVSLLGSYLNPEFIHVNGTAEPLVTVSVPQDIYTAATVTVPQGEFVCIGQDVSSNSTYTSTYSYIDQPSLQITVDLASPITVSGNAMGLMLDLLVSKSETLGSCYSTGAYDPYTVTPTFNLTPMTISPQPSNVGNGKLTGLRGLVASVDAVGSSFAVTAADGPVWSSTSNGATTFQGIAGISALVVGMPVDMDVAMQSDGSLVATRVEVSDTNPSGLTLASGPVEFVAGSQPTLNSLVRLGQGYLYSGGVALGAHPFSFGNAVFQVSGQLTNLQSLPFSASFTAANLVPGQNVSITSRALTEQGGPVYVPAATVTLVPQTINGTVSAVANSGGFEMYTVALAAYDLMPNLAVQGGQNTLLTNPGMVVVYADPNTQMLNSGTIGVGSVMRFNGLVFNDNGTLRMDCAQVNDGVAE